MASRRRNFSPFRGCLRWFLVFNLGIRVDLLPSAECDIILDYLEAPRNIGQCRPWFDESKCECVGEAVDFADETFPPDPFWEVGHAGARVYCDTDFRQLP